jgi:hypothetical protein
MNTDSFSRYVLIACLYLIFLVQPVAADSALENRVGALLKSLKERGSYSALLEYIDWPSEFGSIPKEQRENLKIKSSDQLKELVNQFLLDPSRMIETEWSNREETLTPLQKEILRPSVDQKINEVRNLWRQKNTQLTQTPYQILKTIKQKKNDSLADVLLGIEGQPNAAPWTLSFRKRNSQWYLQPNHENIDITKILSSYRSSLENQDNVVTK